LGCASGLARRARIVWSGCHTIFYIRPWMMTFELARNVRYSMQQWVSSAYVQAVCHSFGDGGSGSFFVIYSSVFNVVSIFIHFFSRFLCFFISFGALNLNLLSSTVHSFYPSALCSTVFQSILLGIKYDVLNRAEYSWWNRIE
jgi:hypothetical protein